MLKLRRQMYAGFINLSVFVWEWILKPRGVPGRKCSVTREESLHRVSRKSYLYQLDEERGMRKRGRRDRKKPGG